MFRIVGKFLNLMNYLREVTSTSDSSYDALADSGDEDIWSTG